MKVKENMALYIRYASVCTQSIMEYKLSFLLMVFARFMMAFGELTAIKFLFAGITQINGYTYGDILLCFPLYKCPLLLRSCSAMGSRDFPEWCEGENLTA